ncbi:MAG: type II toxin-antitoxin system VapB family antitoxin [Pseudomonadota bacterium]|jgi:antitoxin VapB
MALYVKDEEVDRLAREVQAAYGVKTKTEAVRIALQRALDQTEAKPTLREQLDAIRRRIREDYGPDDPDFDDKAYFDQIWGT